MLTRTPHRGFLKRTILFCLSLTLMVVGCREVTVGQPRSLSISVQAEQTQGVVGESVDFFYEAEGRSLVEIRMAYGDGSVEIIETFGAQTAGGVRTHAYEESGDFLVLAQVEEADGRILADSLMFTVVNP